MLNFFHYCLDFHIILNSNFNKLLEIRLENITDYYNARQRDKDNFNLDPKHLFLDKTLLNHTFKQHKIIKLYDYNLKDSSNFINRKISNLSSIKKDIDFNFIKKFFTINKKKIIFICCKNIGSLTKIKNILTERLELKIFSIENIGKLSNHPEIYISVLPINESIEYNNFIFLNEKSIFGYNLLTKRKSEKNKEIFFDELNKFSKGSILVHSEYGFCKFININKLNINNSLHDCIELEFADNQKLFLPIENLNFVTKYDLGNDFNINLDRLGNAHWQKRKAAAKNKIKEIAKDLIKVAVERLKTKSYKINIDHSEYEKFVSTFPFIETDDQINAINDVISDFTKKIPLINYILFTFAFLFDFISIICCLEFISKPGPNNG